MKSIYALFVLCLNTLLLYGQLATRLSPTFSIGSIVSINIHPTGVGYAVQECGNMLTTADHGRSWTAFSGAEIPDESYFNSIHYLDQFDNTKWIFLSQYGVYLTNDGFATLLKFDNVPYAGLMNGFVQLSDGTWIISGGGLVSSSDQGTTWTAHENTDISGRSILEHKGHVFTGFRDIWKSSDSGKTYTKVFEIGKPIRKFLEYDGKLIAAVGDALYISEDEGDTWNLIDSKDYYGSSDNLLAFDNTLVANSSNRINYSTDGGLTWSSMIMPEGIYRTSSLYANKYNELIVGGEDGQVYFTAKVDDTVSLINGDYTYLTSLAILDGRFYCVGSQQSLLSGNVDGSDIELTKAAVGLDLIATLGTNIVLTDNEGIMYLMDPNSLQLTEVAQTDTYFSRIYYSEADQLSYALTRTEVYKSDDKGQTWSIIKVFNDEIYAMAGDKYGNLYIVTESREIWRSVNGGVDWDLLHALVGSGLILDVEVLGNYIYVLASDGLYHSMDEGVTFSAENRPYNGNELLALSEDELVCLAVNGSETWVYKSIIGEPMKQVYNSCANNAKYGAIDRGTRTLYLCGASLGVEKLVFGESSANKEIALASIQTLIYPNPVTETLVVDKSILPHIQYTEIRDMQGRLHLMTSASNEYLDVSSLSQGMYILKVGTTMGTLSHSFVKM